MSYSKKELLTLPTEERRELASDLIDSILVDETEPVSDWKKELILDRIELDNAHPGDGIEWNELRKKYSYKWALNSLAGNPYPIALPTPLPVSCIL